MTDAAAKPRRVAGPIVGVDLGGTKAQFVAFDGAGDEVLRVRYACRDFASFDGIVDRFLGELRAVDGAGARPRGVCIGMAGPVQGRQATLTNLPWTIDADALQRRTGIAQVLLVNDFHAAASGIAQMSGATLLTMQPGLPMAGACRVVVGAGTGLGVATMVPHGDQWQVIAGEGGHVGFAPADAMQVALWQWLHRDGQRVFAERVLSGAGIASIYRFVREHAGRPPGPLLDADDPAAAVAATALGTGATAPGTGATSLGSGATPAAAGRAAGDASGAQGPAIDADTVADANTALDLFASIYGAFAGDLALLVLPRGGLYLAGGIAPKVFDARRSERFLKAFGAKGVHHMLMGAIPVHLVLEPLLGAIGAAAIAASAVRRTRRVARPGTDDRRQ